MGTKQGLPSSFSSEKIKPWYFLYRLEALASLIDSRTFPTRASVKNQLFMLYPWGLLLIKGRAKA
uniref:Uncharacterized protein n=1 Tax=Utricularia reniformis TaxID=192314 RepID=A0A1Y0B4Q1_9LAMI|nr:hypothetical protein AEK19_MT2160 [Utricularia reniformis]ART32309.1 hypothetical protein AEK19_MT2160 [Utricularia reniformis]